MKNLQQLTQAEATNFKETPSDQLQNMLREIIYESRELSNPSEAWRLTSEKKKFLAFLESKEGVLRTELAGRGIVCNDLGEKSNPIQQKIVLSNKDT